MMIVCQSFSPAFARQFDPAYIGGPPGADANGIGQKRESLGWLEWFDIARGPSAVTIGILEIFKPVGTGKHIIKGNTALLIRQGFIDITASVLWP